MPLMPLNVVVRVGESWELDAVRDSVARELAVLLDDLALNAQPVLEVSRSADFAVQQIEISVDGRPCPNRPHDYAAGRNPSAHRVQEMLHANIESLLTPAIVASLWQAWSADGAPQPASLPAMLRKLVHYRLRTDRITRFVATWNETDPPEMFEAALSEASRRVCIELHTETLLELDPELNGLDEMFRLMRDGLFYELGIRVGECVLVANPASERNAIRIRINDLRSPPFPLITSNECLVNDTVERLRLLAIPARKAFNPANGNECAVVSREFKDACEAAGLTTWTPDGYAVLVTSSVIRRAAFAFMSADLAVYDLNNLAQAFPVLVDGIRQQLGPVRFAQVLRALLEEEIAVRNLPLIIDSILRLPPRTPIDFDKYILFGSTYGSVRLVHSPSDALADTDSVEIAECVRMNLRRYISHKYTRGQNTLIVYLIDPKIEERMREARPLDDSEHQALLAAVSYAVGSLPPTAQSPVLLTTSSVRYRLRQEVRGMFASLAVLSYQELSPDMNIQPIARISL